MAKHNESKIRKACDYLQEKHNAQWAQCYGEPGYTDPPRGIILANWNDVPKGLATWLETCGFELEWSDEWTICDNGKAWRVSPDSYGWESSVIYTDDGEMLTRDDSPADIIEAIASTDEGQPARAFPSWVSDSDLMNEGYTLFIGGMETGFHHGQTDSPDAQLTAAFDAGAERAVCRVTSAGQFDVHWEVWALRAEEVTAS